MNRTENEIGPTLSLLTDRYCEFQGDKRVMILDSVSAHKGKLSFEDKELSSEKSWRKEISDLLQNGGSDQSKVILLNVEQDGHSLLTGFQYDGSRIQNLNHLRVVGKECFVGDFFISDFFLDGETEHFCRDKIGLF